LNGLTADEDALSIEAKDGEVVMTGPRVAVALTPAAAAETARRLAEAAGNLEADGDQASQTGSAEA
jgi:predicted RecA/RadA family phage recombinase